MQLIISRTDIKVCSILFSGFWNYFDASINDIFRSRVDCHPRFFCFNGGIHAGVPTRTLGIEELELLESEKKIGWPSISVEDIEDKSKGDFVSKGFAVLQTTWFIVQCITRGIVGLNLTELELATLAFAVLNVVLYTLWWDKPLGVIRPVPVHLRHPGTSAYTSLDPPPSPSFQRPSIFTIFWVYISTKFKEKGLFCLIYILFIEPFSAIALSVVDMWTCDALPDRPARFSVPTFYAPFSSKNKSAIRIGLGIGILFGGIHCIAWSFYFPSVQEQSIWRSAALTTITIPLVLFLHSFNKHRTKETVSFFPRYLCDFVELSMDLFAVVMYCASRIALLVLPLLALRSLSPESLLDFKWSSFVPHI